MKMTFENWLRKQKERDDPIGDLAKDFIDSYKIILKEKQKRFKVKETMEYFGACSDARIAYDEAMKEYKENK